MDIVCFNIDDLPDEEFIFHLNKLPQQQQSYVLKFHRLKDRKHRLMARVMLQKYLEENGFDPALNVLKKDARGCPYIENGPEISIAHSGKYVLLAINKENKTGVDIEEMKAIDFGLMSNNFHPGEITYLKQFNFDTHRFYELWTRKEALLKALGIGMMEGLDNISVLDNPAFFKQKWVFKSLEVDHNYACNICSAEIKEVNINRPSYNSFCN